MLELANIRLAARKEALVGEVRQVFANHLKGKGILC